LILAGMVALNISVWRWLLKNDRMSRICMVGDEGRRLQGRR
jgi:hypothetical protein